MQNNVKTIKLPGNGGFSMLTPTRLGVLLGLVAMGFPNTKLCPGIPFNGGTSSIDVETRSVLKQLPILPSSIKNPHGNR